MIRYGIPPRDLERLIEKEKTGWIAAAAEQTKANRKAGQFIEGRVGWSNIKQAFVAAQQGKCIYCERKIGDGSDKKVAWDVEHYRPKGRVRKWTHAADVGVAAKTGYYLLALNWHNYVASCKRCNSTYKKDYFPIAKPPRRLAEERADLLVNEEPYIPFSLGLNGDDPEELITFQGVIPRAKSAGVKRRADVVIRFFDLDVSEDLIEERALALVSIYTFLRNLDMGDAEAQKDAADMISLASSDRFAHANCVRSFVALYRRDAKDARLQKEACIAYLKRQARR